MTNINVNIRDNHKRWSGALPPPPVRTSEEIVKNGREAKARLVQRIKDRNK